MPSYFILPIIILPYPLLLCLLGPLPDEKTEILYWWRLVEATWRPGWKWRAGWRGSTSLQHPKISASPHILPEKRGPTWNQNVKSCLPFFSQRQSVICRQNFVKGIIKSNLLTSPATSLFAAKSLLGTLNSNLRTPPPRPPSPATQVWFTAQPLPRYSIPTDLITTFH